MSVLVDLEELRRRALRCRECGAVLDPETVGDVLAYDAPPLCDRCFSEAAKDSEWEREEDR